MYSPNFTLDDKIFCLSLHYNSSSVKWTVLAHLKSQPRGQNFQVQI